MANTTTIEPEYVYMTIPADYVCTYNKILVLLAKFGVDMLQSCQAACTKRNKNIIDCFNMFNAAVAAKKLGQDKLAETIMKYINAQLKILNDNTEITPNIIFPVDENGYIKAVVSCGENPTFTVDAESGELWQQSRTNDLSGDFMLDSTDTASE